jgi:DNA-binding Xre family transcriptional regulator
LKIVYALPPNYEKIKEHFPTANFDKGTLFTYGDTCYCKSITPDLIIHEETHVKQQVNPQEWWEKYFVDVAFRLSQEVEAYRNQWHWIGKNIKDRNVRFKILFKICKDLSGKLYNNMISFDKAKELIINS